MNKSDAETVQQLGSCAHFVLSKLPPCFELASSSVFCTQLQKTLPKKLNTLHDMFNVACAMFDERSRVSEHCRKKYSIVLNLNPRQCGGILFRILKAFHCPPCQKALDLGSLALDSSKKWPCRCREQLGPSQSILIVR